MIFKPCARWEVSLPKLFIIIIFFLVVLVLIFILRNMDILEFQHNDNSKITAQKGSDDPTGFCTFQAVSIEDALEDRLLIDSIAWPTTPPLPDPLSLEQTSDPAHSTFIILLRTGGGQWHVGDQMDVMINIYDFKGFPKESGGDFIIARLHNSNLGAGVCGEVVDHLNGSYSATFSLLWEGIAQVEVTLVHPSEAVTVLRRLTNENPDRISFQSLFRSGLMAQTTTCNVCLRPSQQPLCNFTDLHTGEPWFCHKPTYLNCETRINHSKGKFTQDLKNNEEMLFQSAVNMKVSIQASGPDAVPVLPTDNGQPAVKSRVVSSKLSGYYYKDVWRALSGTTVQPFRTPSAISQCLKGKKVHLYGDSTIRQWFEYLHTTLPDLNDIYQNSPKQVGPFMAVDIANKILVTYRCHGPPIRFTNTLIHELHYIANEIDGLTGGPNTAVVIGVWSHFSTFPVEVYIRRLRSIRRALMQLLEREPGTVVIIRTANLKALTLYEALTNSDWYSLQRDKVLRAMFKGLKVHLVDAWEMGLAHDLPHSLHPQPPIIKNLIDVLLSYICPLKGD